MSLCSRHAHALAYQYSDLSSLDAVTARNMHAHTLEHNSKHTRTHVNSHKSTPKARASYQPARLTVERERETYRDGIKETSRDGYRIFAACMGFLGCLGCMGYLGYLHVMLGNCMPPACCVRNTSDILNFLSRLSHCSCKSSCRL